MLRILRTSCLLLMAVAVSAEMWHTVQPGETLASIAARRLGKASAYATIASMNGIVDPNRISIGQKLRLPDSAIPLPFYMEPVPAKSVDATPTKPPPPLPPDAPGELAAQELLIGEMSGPVEMLRGDATPAATRGGRVRPGDTIRTRTMGRVILTGAAGERITLDENTQAELKEITAGVADRRMILRVDKGRVHFSAPESPFLTRYAIESPTGALSGRYGECDLTVLPPHVCAVSVRRGKFHAQIPRGDVELLAGFGARLRTIELPPLPQPLPLAPGVTLETAPRHAIIAAATRPDNGIRIAVFTDPDLRGRIALRELTVDAIGVAVARIELPDGEYWLTAEAVSVDGLVSPVRLVGPFRIAGETR